MPQEHPVKQVSPAEALASSETIDGGPLSDNQSQSPAISSRGSPQPHDSTIDCPEPPQEMEEVIPPSVSDAQQIPKEPATPDPQEMSSARSSSVTSRLSRSTSPTPTRAAQARSEQQQQTLAEEIAAAASSGNVENSRSPTIEYATNTHALSTTESPQLAAETDESHEGADGENKSEYAEMDWDDLERRFEEQMKECREKEKSLKKEWDQWVEVYLNFFCIVLWCRVYSMVLVFRL